MTLALATALIVLEVILAGRTHRLEAEAIDVWELWAAAAFPMTAVDIDKNKTVPPILPGPADAWAGGVGHSLTLTFSGRVGGMVMLLHVRDAGRDSSPILSFRADGRSAGRHRAMAGSGRLPPVPGKAVAAGYLIPLPAKVFAPGKKHRITITNEQGSWIVIRRIELRPDWQPSSLVLRLLAGVWIGLSVLLLWPLGRAGARAALHLASWLTCTGAVISLVWWGREVVLLDIRLGTITFGACALLWIGGQVLAHTGLGSLWAVGPAWVASKIFRIGRDQ